eukprot:gene9186-10145_t
MSSSLRGKPPQEIYTLTSLHTLTLTNSYFTGSIPLAIVNLTNLEELTLSGCQFTGNVPEEMNQLTSLISIDLTNNYLTGTLSPWLLTNLTNLQSFIIYGNRISGPIPNITTKSSLTLIDMGYNRLTGTLPVSISLGQYLTGVFLEENDLTGTIPPEWGSLSLLWDLYLNDNALRGNIPSTLQNLQNLKILSLSNNINIIGTIPMGLGNITGLQHLLLSDCSLTGSLPSGLGSQKYLYELDVGLNYLTGSIPSQLYQTSHLSSLSLHNNLLTGTLSTQCVTWLALNYLILDNNIMHGSIPSILTNFSSLFRLSLGNNLFSGSFNVDLTSVIAIGMLQLEMNQFTGDVSLFMSTKENIMEYFNITTNYFSGDLSRLSLMTSLAVADFSQNLISVNGFYVYISLELKRWSAVMLSVALSFFKVIWSLIIQTWLTKYLQPLQHLPCEGRTEEEEEKNVSKHGERLIDWRRLLPTLWKRSARSVASTTGSNQPQDSGSLSSSSQGGIVFFSAAEYAIRLVMMLSCLLTFGVTIPYLAILIGFSIVSNTYLVQLGWLYQWKHRMLTAGQQVNDSSSFTQLCKQCGRLFHCMRLALPPMIFFLPLFFAYFLFDTAGDKGGWVMGLCFALSLVAVCILVSCSLVFILWHWTSWMRTVTMSHEDSKKNEVCEAEEGPPCVAPPAPSEEESKTQSVSQDSTNIELASTSLVSSSLVNDDSAFVTNAMHHRSC